MIMRGREGDFGDFLGLEWVLWWWKGRYGKLKVVEEIVVFLLVKDDRIIVEYFVILVFVYLDDYCNIV